MEVSSNTIGCLQPGWLAVADEIQKVRAVDGENTLEAARRLAKIELIARTDRFTVFKSDQDEAVIYEKSAAGKAVLKGMQARSFWEELMSLKAISD